MALKRRVKLQWLKQAFIFKFKNCHVTRLLGLITLPSSTVCYPGLSFLSSVEKSLCVYLSMPFGHRMAVISHT